MVISPSPKSTMARILERAETLMSKGVFPGRTLVSKVPSMPQRLVGQRMPFLATGLAPLPIPMNSVESS